jgi:chromosome segregation ATPase
VQRAHELHEQKSEALTKIAILEHTALDHQRSISELEARLLKAQEAAVVLQVKLVASQDLATSSDREETPQQISRVQPQLEAALESVLHLGSSTDGSESGKEELASQLEAARTALSLLAEEIERQELEQDGHTTVLAQLMQQLVSSHEQVQDLQSDIVWHVTANNEVQEKLDEVERTFVDWAEREKNLTSRAAELDAERSAVAAHLAILQADLDDFHTQHDAVASMLQAATEVRCKNDSPVCTRKLSTLQSLLSEARQIAFVARFADVC